MKKKKAHKHFYKNTQIEKYIDFALDHFPFSPARTNPLFIQLVYSVFSRWIQT